MPWHKLVLVVVVSLGLTSFVAAADTVYVGRWDSTTDGPSNRGTIYRLDTTIQGLIPVAIGFDHLTLGTCGSDGYLYWAERGKQRIIRVSQDGRQVTQIFKTLRGGDRWDAPEGPSFDSQGNLYFTNTSGGGVWQMKGANPANGAVQIAHQFEGGQGSYIDGGGTAILSAGPHAGDVIVAHLSKNVVYRVSPSDFCTSSGQTNCGRPEVFLQENLNRPYGLATNNQGEIFVGNAGAQLFYITRFAPDGSFLGDFVTVGSGGEAIAFDSQDNLWAVTSNAVFKINSSGEKALVTSVPNYGSGIAICKDSAANSTNSPTALPRFPVELTSLWLALGLYAFGRRKISR